MSFEHTFDQKVMTAVGSVELPQDKKDQSLYLFSCTSNCDKES